MRAVLQRVSSARVTVDGNEVGAIGPGIVVLLGVERDDTAADVDRLADKVRDLRIFDDDQGRLNRSVVDIGGSVLVVSQFTLCADCSRGRRPSFVRAARPEDAVALYEAFVARLRASGVTVATGAFRAMMQVSLVNEGPVTLILDSKQQLD
jgi:D-tyrosyl-tRNA(Tyr) deacylase